MPANFESGFVVRTPAWHGLAPVLAEYPGSWAEARKLAGLDWEPVESPIYVGHPTTVEDIFGTEETHDQQLLPEWKAIVRSDTKAVLSVQYKTYELFPNAELGPLVETFVQEPDVQYETAGVLNGGNKVWVLVRLREPFEIPGDPHGRTLSRIGIQNSHDGSGALRVQRLQTRIVCDNTSMAADREAGEHGLEYRFRHTTNMRDHIDEAKQVINGLKSDRQRYIDWAHELLGIRVTEAQREQFIETFIPQPVDQGAVSDRVKRNVEEAQGALRAVILSPTTREVQHTAYGLVQGATEYLDHVRRFKSRETHFTRSYLSPEPLKRKAESIAREIAFA
jgi:phage/plasmid-like protein (TIGR03299 family)